MIDKEKMRGIDETILGIQISLFLPKFSIFYRVAQFLIYVYLLKSSIFFSGGEV